MSTTPKVLLKRSSQTGRVPAAGDLDYGELAINFADGKIYYKDNTNTIKAFVDSARVQSIADAVEVVAQAQLDSGEVTSLVDSAYVQARVPLSYLESLIDSAYVQARQIYYTGFDSDFDARLAIKTTDNLTEGSTNLYYTKARVDSDIALSLNDSGNVVNITISNTIYDTVDSAYVNARVNAANYLDSAEAIQLIDSAYVQARQITYDFLDSAEAVAIIDSHVNKTFVDALNIDADRLDGYHGNYYLDWNNTTNKPTILDLVDVSTQITADVDKAFVDALNVDADTVDGYHAQAFFDAIDSAVNALIDGAPGALDTLNELAAALNDDSDAYNNLLSLIAAKLDSAEAIALIDSAHVRARQDYAYSSLTGVPTNVSSFTNDANYLDSTAAQALIDSAYISTVYNQSLNTTDDVIFNTVQAPVTFRAKNDAGSTLNVGEVVYIKGVDGNTPTVDRADADDANKMPAFGIVAVAANDQANVEIVTFGALQGVNTTGYMLGQTVYVSTTPGQFTNDKPSGVSSLIQNIGQVVRVASNGIIRVGGAGRTNATPNLNAGQIFYGNDSNYSVATDLTSVIDSAYINQRITPHYTGFDSDFGTKTTDDLTEGSTNLYYTKARADSDIAASLNDSGNTVNITINNTITDTVDSAYVLARVAEAPFLDSADAIQLIDSVYVQARQDYAYGSLTGTPYIPTFGNDYIDSATVVAIIASEGLDSDLVTQLVDSAYIQLRDRFQDSSLVTSTVDSSYVQIRVPESYLSTIIDSDYVLARSPAGIDSALVVQIIDSAYVQARQSGVDSAAIIQLVDSAYVIARAGASTDSAAVSAIILSDVDSAYVQARQLNETAAPLTQSVYNFTATAAQTSFTGLNIDSDKFQVYLNGLLLPRADYTHNSTQLDLIVAADSGDVLEIVKFSGNDTGAQAIQQRHYIYTATSGQTVFTGADDNGSTLSYTQNRINVYLNGLLLLDSDDYTQNGAGTTVTFTSGVTAGHVVDIQTLSGNTGTFAPLEQTLYEFTADSGQTVFTGLDNNSATLDFSNDKITVYLNGILLSSGDYTPSGGNTITLDVGADSGNLLTVAKLSGNNIGLDSAQVNALIGAAAPNGVDSAAIIAMVDSAYVQARTLPGTDSAATQAMIDSNFLNVGSHFIPALDSTYDLGTPSKKWRDLYLSGNTI